MRAYHAGCKALRTFLQLLVKLGTLKGKPPSSKDPAVLPTHRSKSSWQVLSRDLPRVPCRHGQLPKNCTHTLALSLSLSLSVLV